MTKQLYIKKYTRYFVNNISPDESETALIELSAIVHLTKTSKIFNVMFRSPLFKQKERQAVFQLIADQARLSRPVVDFLIFLNNHNALDCLERIIKNAKLLLSKRQKVLTVDVFVAESPDLETVQTIEETAVALLKREIKMNLHIDQSIIGGLIIKAGSMVYDASIQGQLQELSQILTEAA
jgi:F-type H+-transporting ATPase subunit delta